MPLVVAPNGQVVASLALPVVGLLSEQPLEEVVAKLGELERAVSELCCVAPSPFSLLALPVIPELRLTDLGLVDARMGQILSPLPTRAGNPCGQDKKKG
jgi:adenine deaminase